MYHNVLVYRNWLLFKMLGNHAYGPTESQIHLELSRDGDLGCSSSLDPRYYGSVIYKGSFDRE